MKVASVVIVVGAIGIVPLSIWFMNNAPEQVPMHFGLDGEPTRYGSPSEFWFLIPFFVLMPLILIMVWKPHRGNYAGWVVKGDIPDEAWQRIYGIARIMYLVLTAIAVGLGYVILLVIFHSSEGPFVVLLWLGIVALIGLAIWGSLASRKIAKESE